MCVRSIDLLCIAELTLHNTWQHAQYSDPTAAAPDSKHLALPVAGSARMACATAKNAGHHARRKVTHQQMYTSKHQDKYKRSPHIKLLKIQIACSTAGNAGRALQNA